MGKKPSAGDGRVKSNVQEKNDKKIGCKAMISLFYYARLVTRL